MTLDKGNLSKSDFPNSSENLHKKQFVVFALWKVVAMAIKNHWGSNINYNSSYKNNNDKRIVHADIKEKQPSLT